MATWFEIKFTGEPTEDDFQRVSELASEGYTSGQLINGDDVPCAECQKIGDHARTCSYRSQAKRHR